MTDIFIMKLDQIQPSQLFISSDKLNNVLRDYDRFKPELVEPLPVKKLGKRVVLTDGHTRALAVFLRGALEARVYWDEEELDEDAYKTCVTWCRKEGVTSITDLKDKVVSAEEYDKLWVKRCEKMVRRLDAKRAKTLSVVVDTVDQEYLVSK
jgi:hypothetical protein